MRLSEVFGKMADFHRAHPCYLGLAFGIAAGVGLTYTGFSHDLAWAITDRVLSADASPEQRVSQTNIWLQNQAALVTLASVITDAVIYKLRGPKPPAP